MFRNKYFIPTKFHHNPSSGSGEEFENVKSLQTDGRVDGQPTARHMGHIPCLIRFSSMVSYLRIECWMLIKRSAFMYIVTCLISDVHFHITGPKLAFKTYNYRHCDTSMSPKTADYFPSGGVIATLLGYCKVLCYANMNVILFRVSAN